MLAAVVLSVLSAPAPDPAVQKAAEVLAAARAAIGVKDTVAFTLKADVRRLVPAPDGQPGEMSGGIRVDALFPGRFKRAESLSPMPGAPPFTIVFGLDGEAAWTETAAPHGGGAMFFRVRPGGGGPPDEAALRRRLRAEYARLALATLLATDAATPLEARYVALAEAPEGKADALELTGADGFTARLFVDTATHRPLMLTYRDRRPRVMMRRLEGPPPAGGHPPLPDGPPDAAPEEEATLHLEDFRAQDGVLLPHRLTLSYDGTPAEEWTVREFELNPPLDAAAFRKK